MNYEVLTEVGLTVLQAQAYTYLLENGATSPPGLTKALNITRTNAYKILDQLIALQLVKRLKVDKKLVYQAEDPIALASIVAEERNRVIALEKHAKTALKQLRMLYQKSSAGSEVQTYQGPVAVKALYEHQANLRRPIYFVKTRADIPTLGYEAMARIRNLTVKYGVQRYGITPDAPEGALNPEIDRRSNLTRTWMSVDDYISPVEWTVSGDELMIINFEEPISALRIKNQTIADAFVQLWKMLDEGLRNDKDYKKLPRFAKRKI